MSAPRVVSRVRGTQHLPAVAALLATSWMYRATFLDGRLPGDDGDARWTLALHEHWLRVWQGQEAIRDLHYYFPLPDVLGTSEAFVVQGHLHVLLRLVGLDIEHAWLVTQVAFFLGGALGVAYLSHRLFRTRAAQTAFVLLTCCSYPVTAGFVNVQLIGFLYVAWLAAAALDLLRARHQHVSVALLTVGPPLLALSCWYAFVLGAIAGVVLLLMLALFHERAVILGCLRDVAGALRRFTMSRVGVPLYALAIAGYAMVLWIYLPARSILAAPVGDELTYFSPRWSDIVSANVGGGGIWKMLYDDRLSAGISNVEQSRGFTPVLLVTFLVVAVGLLRRCALGRPDVGGPGVIGRPALMAVCGTCVVLVASVIIDERGLGIFALAWNHVPGMNSIRGPFRVQALTYALVFVVILRHLEDRVLTAPRARRTLATGLSALLVVTIFVEMQRPTTTTSAWTTQDTLPAPLRERIPEVRERCDAVMVANEDDGAEWVRTHIDGVVLATLAGISTPQGYSRGTPVGYPFFVQDIATWARDQGFDGRLCLVSSTGLEVLP